MSTPVGRRTSRCSHWPSSPTASRAPARSPTLAVNVSNASKLRLLATPRRPCHLTGGRRGHRGSGYQECHRDDCDREAAPCSAPRDTAATYPLMCPVARRPHTWVPIMTSRSPCSLRQSLVPRRCSASPATPGRRRVRTGPRQRPLTRPDPRPPSNGAYRSDTAAQAAVEPSLTASPASAAAAANASGPETSARPRRYA